MFLFAELSLVDQYGLPLLKIYRRRFERGFEEFYIESTAIPRESDHNTWGAMTVRYNTDGQKQVLLQGYGEIGERKVLNSEEHPFLEQYPQKIYFRKTIKKLIEQAKSANFNLPHLHYPKSVRRRVA